MGEEDKKISYRDSGVDVTRGYETVDRIKKFTRSTYTENVLGDLGSFAGFCKVPASYKEPVLVSGTDGVGTKLRYAINSGRNDTIGIDAVAMCCNDIVCQGAEPLFFLDYFSTGRLDPAAAESVIAGVAEGCKRAGCALIGGETAEMPGFYGDGEYDLAGFAVGVAEKGEIIDGKKIVPGDVLVGLESDGIHSNGYSLVRTLFGEDTKALEKDMTLGEPLLDILLKPTRIYVKSALELIKSVEVKGLVHITGGGFIENIPRIFPEGVGCVIDTKSYEIPAIFELLRKKSNLEDRELYNTFNMGVGMVAVVAKENVSAAVEKLKELGERPHVIGECVKGEGVTLK